MSAADRRFSVYTDAQWAAIAALVNPGKISPSALAEYLASARGSLTDIGQVYVGTPKSIAERVVLPPWQRAQRRKKLRATLIAARAVLDDYDLGLGVPAIEARKQARTALDVVIANIRVAIPRAGNKNAKRVHIQYWRKLAGYYEVLHPGHSPKQLIAFVHACSRPVFPGETTLEAVSSFAYRFCKRPRI